MIFRLAIALVALLLVGAGCQPIVAPDDSLVVENAVEAQTPTALPEPTDEPPQTGPKFPIVLGETTREIVEITSQALEGNLIGDPATREFIVVLPPGYGEGDTRYPVVYGLHWYTGGPYDMYWEIVPEYEELLHEGAVQEMIFVFPDAANAFQGSMYMSSPTIGDYETYLVEELVDLIDASYRTIPGRDSRAATGCSMGGSGALHLSMAYPEVYGVAASVSGPHDVDPERDPGVEQALTFLNDVPENLSEFNQTYWAAQRYMAWAAAVAADPDNPPLYLEMPFQVVDGDVQIVPEVFAKMMETDNMREIERYVEQPIRLNALLLYASEVDSIAPIEVVEALSQRMTELGVEHEMELYRLGHCDNDWTPVIEFLSDNLVGESP